ALGQRQVVAPHDRGEGRVDTEDRVALAIDVVEPRDPAVPHRGLDAGVAGSDPAEDALALGAALLERLRAVRSLEPTLHLAVDVAGDGLKRVGAAAEEGRQTDHDGRGDETTHEGSLLSPSSPTCSHESCTGTVGTRRYA